MIVIKPDGIKTRVSSNLAIGLFDSFGKYLSGQALTSIIGDNCGIMDKLANDAHQQILERSETEPSFEGDPTTIDSGVCYRLHAVADNLPGDDVAVFRVIILGLVAFGYDLEIRKHTLCYNDVDSIYSLSDRCDFHLSERLHNYLDGEPVLIVAMSNGPAAFIVQHWKTFLRHFFIRDRVERFPLRNLIHVCEDDRYYVESLLKSEIDVISVQRLTNEGKL